MLAGRVVSVQVGRPAPLPWGGRDVPSAIVSIPCTDRCGSRAIGFDGNEQADLTADGSSETAACAYPTEHLPAWERRVGLTLPVGAFGEGLSTAGPLEEDVHIGDVMALGTAIVPVS